MVRRVAYLAIIAGIGLTAAGCLGSIADFERRADWRSGEENACMRQNRLAASAYIERVSKIKGRGACGVKKPLKVKALADGTISIGPTATIGCPMTAALEGWMQDAVQPAALAWFGVPVSEIKQISDYSCRRRNNARKGKLSEHAFGNALDIAGFTFVDGRGVTVLKGWKGNEAERGFLREVFAHGCQTFKTALGPGVKYHADHFHFDLAHHNDAGTSRYCRPKMDLDLPVRPPFGGYTIASNRAPVFAPAAPAIFARQPPAPPVYGSPTYAPPVLAQAAPPPPAYGAPLSILPTTMAPLPGPYPRIDPSPGPFVNPANAPRRLPRVDVPMGFAPQ